MIILHYGDGIHDALTIRGLENYSNNTIKIYNRWGVLVFETSQYNNQSNYFDGTSQARVTMGKANRLPVGTYFFMLIWGYRWKHENKDGLYLSKLGKYPYQTLSTQNHYISFSFFDVLNLCNQLKVLFLYCEKGNRRISNIGQPF